MTFAPQRSPISAISQANPCVVTTSQNHNLTTGQVVRLHVPQNFGMTPLNQQAFSVTVLSTTQFSIQFSQIPPAINVNSTNFPAFTIPSKPGFTAEVLPIGSAPTPNLNTSVSTQNNECTTQIADATRNYSTTEIPF